MPSAWRFPGPFRRILRGNGGVRRRFLPHPHPAAGSRHGFRRVPGVSCRSVRLIVTDPAVTGRYSDITGHWAEKEMQAVLSLGLFRGTGSATFHPEKPLTRAELVTVLYRMEGEPSLLAQNPFRDVPGNRWYSNAVIWAAAQGIVTGKTPDRLIPTRRSPGSRLPPFCTATRPIWGQIPPPEGSWRTIPMPTGSAATR